MTAVVAARILRLLAAALVLTACSPTTPSEAPTTPSPTTVGLASPQPTLIPRPSPSVTCQDPVTIEGLRGPIFSCEAAIDRAITALPPAHPEIKFLAFRYGVFCPPNRYCVLPLPFNAHIIVTYADETQVVVSVSGGEVNGGVTVTSIEPLSLLVSPAAT